MLCKIRRTTAAVLLGQAVLHCDVEEEFAAHHHSGGVGAHRKTPKGFVPSGEVGTAENAWGIERADAGTHRAIVVDVAAITADASKPPDRWALIDAGCMSSQANDDHLIAPTKRARFSDVSVNIVDVKLGIASDEIEIFVDSCHGIYIDTPVGHPPRTTVCGFVALLASRSSTRRCSPGKAAAIVANVDSKSPL